MFHLSPDAFYTQAFMAFKRYEQDNAWFKWASNGTEFDMETPVHYIFAGNTAYEKVVANPLKLTLLGDEKLRKDHDLVLNFGLSSAKGVQEEECREFIQGLTNERRKAEGMKEIDWKSKVARPDDKGLKILPIEGTGSILSTKKWSPLLNDSFIISGVHHEHEFSLTLVGEEATLFDTLVAPTSHAERWRKFFLKCPHMLWTEFPRVLTRELIGLMTFGYVPVFGGHQLMFEVKNKKASDGATHNDYLTALSKLSFNNGGKAKVMAALGTYLFGSSEALLPEKADQLIGALGK